MSASHEMSPEQMRKFAYTTLHHLQEPVRMVGLYTSMLEKAATGESAQEMAEPMEFLRKAAGQMQKLLDGLSELIAVTVEQPTHKSNVALDLPLRQAILNLDSDIQKNGASLHHSNLPSINGNFDRLQLLFAHLLRNALLYRGEPSPEIWISAQPSGTEWVVAVRDNGCGIAPEFRERVFDPYMRLHGKTIPGIGLGLPICRAIVAEHGGRLWVESDAARGSTFTFTLPKVDETGD